MSTVIVKYEKKLRPYSTKSLPSTSIFSFCSCSKSASSRMGVSSPVTKAASVSGAPLRASRTGEANSSSISASCWRYCSARRR